MVRGMGDYWSWYPKSLRLQKIKLTGYGSCEQAFWNKCSKYTFVNIGSKMENFDRTVIIKRKCKICPENGNIWQGWKKMEDHARDRGKVRESNFPQIYKATKNF